MKQYPNEFDFKKKPGEGKSAYEWRMLETNTKTTQYNWMPKDKNRGVRQTKTGGAAFPKQIKPFP